MSCSLWKKKIPPSLIRIPILQLMSANAKSMSSLSLMSLILMDISAFKLEASLYFALMVPIAKWPCF